MLTPFWFHTDHGLGYGVTARSMVDAEHLLRDFGYPRAGELVMAIVSGITHAQLEQDHVVPHAGPIMERGVWFPNHTFSD